MKQAVGLGGSAGGGGHGKVALGVTMPLIKVGGTRLCKPIFEKIMAEHYVMIAGLRITIRL